MPRRRVRPTRLLLLLTVPAWALAGACSEEAGLSEEEQEYSDAFAATLGDDEDGLSVEADEAECMADAVMEELGVEPFEEKDVSPEDIKPGEDGSPGELLGDDAVSQEQAEAIVDVWDEECVDVVAIMAKSAESEFELDPDGEECFVDGLGEGDLAKRLLIPSFTDADGTPEDEDLAALLRVMEECGGDEGSPIVQAIAESLAADGSLTDEQAQCLAQGVVDELGLERMSELFSTGDFGDLDADAQNEVAGALLQAASGCGVSPSDFGG